MARAIGIACVGYQRISPIATAVIKALNSPLRNSQRKNKPFGYVNAEKVTINHFAMVPTMIYDND